MSHESNLHYTNEYIDPKVNPGVDQNYNQKFLNSYEMDSVELEKQRLREEMEMRRKPGVSIKTVSQGMDPSLDNTKVTYDVKEQDKNVEYLNKDVLTLNKERVHTFNLDSINRDYNIYPYPHTLKMKLPKSVNNIKEIEIKSLEFPNSQQIITSSNNKLRWMNQYDHGTIADLYIQDVNPSYAPSHSEIESNTGYPVKFMKITCWEPVYLKRGEKIKITGLVIWGNQGLVTSTTASVEGNQGHSIAIGGDGVPSLVNTSGRSHVGTILDYSDNTVSIIPSHYKQFTVNVAGAVSSVSGTDVYLGDEYPGKDDITGESIVSFRSTKNDYYNGMTITFSKEGEASVVRTISDYQPYPDGTSVGSTNTPNYKITCDSEPVGVDSSWLFTIKDSTSYYQTWNCYGAIDQTLSPSLNGEEDNCYVGWKMHITSGRCEGQVRKITGFTKVLSNNKVTHLNVTIGHAWDGVTPSVNDTYEIIDDSYVVHCGAGDDNFEGERNEFWIIDYNTSLIGDSSPQSAITSVVGKWTIDRDEFYNYVKKSEQKIYVAEIPVGNYPGGALSQSLQESMNKVRNINGDFHSFEITINGTTNKITIRQNNLYQIKYWTNYYKYGITKMDGPLFSRSGRRYCSGSLMGHGFKVGRILGVVPYPPGDEITDKYNMWDRNSPENGWPVTDLNTEVYGFAMIITNFTSSGDCCEETDGNYNYYPYGKKTGSDASKSSYTKNPFNINTSIEISNTNVYPDINGVHEIVHVPRTTYKVNDESGNYPKTINNQSPGCYCFVISKKILTPSKKRDDYIKITDNIGNFGEQVTINDCVGIAGVFASNINGERTVKGSGLINEQVPNDVTQLHLFANFSSLDVTYSDSYDLNYFYFDLGTTASGNVNGGGGPLTRIGTGLPFKLLFKDYIDDVGPILGYTDANNKQDTEGYRVDISNTEDGSLGSTIKRPIDLLGSKFLYFVVNGIQGIEDMVNIKNIFFKIPLKGSPGTIIFNPLTKNPKVSFDPPIPSIDELDVSVVRPVNPNDNPSHMDIKRRKTTSMAITIKMTKIKGYSINDIANGFMDNILKLKSRSTGKRNLLMGSGLGTGNEKKQFKKINIQSIMENGISYFLLTMKIFPQKDIDYNARLSDPDTNPIDPVDIATYIKRNLPGQTSSHTDTDLVYIRESGIVGGVEYVGTSPEVEKILDFHIPPAGTDFYEFNNTDFSLTLDFVENISVPLNSKDYSK